MTPDERLDRMIEFVGASFTRLEMAQEKTETNLAALTVAVTGLADQMTGLADQVRLTLVQVAKTAAAQETTEERLQKLIDRVDRIAG